MSHSYRNSGYISNSVAGFKKGIKKDKMLNNKMLRRITRHRLKSCNDLDRLILPERLDEVMNRYDYTDDGRNFYPRSAIESWDKPWQYLIK